MLRTFSRLLAVSLVAMGCSGSASEGDDNTNTADDTGSSSTSETGDETTVGDDTGATGEDTGASGDDTGSPSDATDDEGSGVIDGDAPADASGVTGATIPNLKVAFIGDQGANSNTTAVLKLIKSEGAQFVIILGDFDYTSNPDKWDAQLTTGLGADFPVFAAAGNHDVTAWPDYKKKLDARLAKISGAKCTGVNGEKATCNYLGLTFILSAVGTMGSRSDHEAYLKSALAADKSIWRVCAWHKNQHDMQVGGKSDEVGWVAYQTCQNAGALIMTGHEHSYSRTKSLNALGNASKGHGAFGDLAKLVVKEGAPGNTFVTVSGLGGVGIRDYESASHSSDTWWASYYASNAHVKNGVKLTTPQGYGATFVTFNVDGDARKARGYFKNVAGVEIDSFEVRRE